MAGYNRISGRSLVESQVLRGYRFTRITSWKAARNKLFSSGYNNSPLLLLHLVRCLFDVHRSIYIDRQQVLFILIIFSIGLLLLLLLLLFYFGLSYLVSFYLFSSFSMWIERNLRGVEYSFFFFFFERICFLSSFPLHFSFNQLCNFRLHRDFYDRFPFLLF